MFKGLLGIASAIFFFHSQEIDLHNGWNSVMLSNFFSGKKYEWLNESSSDPEKDLLYGRIIATGSNFMSGKKLWMNKWFAFSSVCLILRSKQYLMIKIYTWQNDEWMHHSIFS